MYTYLENKDKNIKRYTHKNRKEYINYAFYKIYFNIK